MAAMEIDSLPNSEPPSLKTNTISVPPVEDADSEDENDVLDKTDVAPTHESKRRRQHALFKTWMLQQAATDIQHSNQDRRSKHPEKEQLSISQIIGEQESEHIIDDPREYQLELFERAKQQNTIAVLDTGTGKTLIAVLLLRHVIEQELEDRLQGKPHRIAFFLVPAVNLVFQQQAVLKNNLNFEIARVYGAMGIDLWTKDRWNSLFSNHKVIVCTPEVLHLCLAHGFIRMNQINLLIFDEAHHAKQQHPYCKIMRDYFDQDLDSSLQPRVFGMTASPIDAKADEEMDVIQLAIELEATLHSTIATTSHLAPLTNYVHRPKEVKLQYSALPSPTHTSFSAEISNRYGHFHFLKKMSDRAAAINAHLGFWCADRYWHLALPEKIARKSDLHLERYTRRYDSPMNGAQNEDEVARMRELLNFVSSKPVPQPSGESSISSKVEALHTCLMDFFSGPSDYKCIVFVRERHTATLLAELFNVIGGLHLKCGSLIGIGAIDLANPSSTLREQVLMLQRFRQGHLNCLFATSVAEEGLDVPSCNLIIRFDHCQTMIQYVQSRGRARHRHSTFVHMLESGNKEHAIMLEDNQRAENIMRSFCARLPEDRKLTGNEDFFTAEIQSGITSYQVSSSGAKLTASNAVVFLAHFVSTLPNSGNEPLRPQYAVQPTAGGFICEVVLPYCSPIRGMQGKPKRRKVLAKCSAAFHTCVELRQQGFLDDNLLPVYKDRLPVMRNAALALELKGQSRYTMKNKPNFWNHGQQPQVLYGLLVDFSAGLDQPHRPMVLLSRNRLHEFPEFPLYLNSGVPSQVIARPLDGVLDLDQETLELLTKFTLKIFKDIFNKTYEFEPAKMSYWAAPAKQMNSTNVVTVASALDWAAINEACIDEDYRWTTDMAPESIINKFLVDPFDGGKRYFTKQLAEGLRAFDPNPDHVKQDGSGPKVIETSVSLWRKSKMKANWNVDQPVYVADRVLHRRNMLAEVANKELEEKARCFVCPEPLRISRIAVDIAASCYALPAVVWRIESYLIAQEAFQHLNLDATPSLALEALTKDSDATGEYGEDASQIRFQRGMGRNYERLEFLGDTFLKMATTIATYVKNPGDTEFDYHVKRMLQLCNQNLLNVALEIGLADSIRSQSFSRRTWYPEGIKLLEGKGHKNTGDNVLYHKLGEKTIADVSEAIIGASWLSHNKPGAWTPESWDNAVRAVTTLVKSEIHTMMEWHDYQEAYILPEWQKQQPKAHELYTAEKVSHLHSYQFKNPRLLHAVFTHPSMPTAYESVKSYQQLEFLGDSLLDMACVSHLMYRYPDKDPGWLTEHKGAMVANKFLGALCVLLGFHPNLRHSTHGLGTQIKNYAEELVDAKRVSGGAVDFWTTVNDPPKCLADVVEAYVGAMFLDSGFDYNQVQRFFDQHMLPYFEHMEIYDQFAHNHPVVRLHKLLGETLGCRGYRLFAEEEPAVDNGPARAYAALLVHDMVIAGDVSHSTRYGKARSADNALKELEGLSVSQFRAKYGCDCKAEDAVGAVEIGTAV